MTNCAGNRVYRFPEGTRSTLHLRTRALPPSLWSRVPTRGTVRPVSRVANRDLLSARAARFPGQPPIRRSAVRLSYQDPRLWAEVSQVSLRVFLAYVQSWQTDSRDSPSSSSARPVPPRAPRCTRCRSLVHGQLIPPLEHPEFFFPMTLSNQEPHLPSRSFIPTNRALRLWVIHAAPVLAYADSSFRLFPLAGVSTACTAAAGIFVALSGRGTATTPRPFSYDRVMAKAH